MYRAAGLFFILLGCSITALAGTDPMRPPVVTQPSNAVQQPIDSSRWQLNLIRQTGNGRLALLNGKLIGVGGMVNGARVTEIGAQRVTLKLPDERSIRLALPSVQLKYGSN